LLKNSDNFIAAPQMGMAKSVCAVEITYTVCLVLVLEYQAICLIQTPKQRIFTCPFFFLIMCYRDNNLFRYLVKKQCLAA